MKTKQKYICGNCNKINYITTPIIESYKCIKCGSRNLWKHDFIQEVMNNEHKRT